MDIRTAKSAPEKKSSSNRRFEIAKTGIIGLQRDTMLENELHLLPQLGKSRSRGHRLPPHNYTYGTTYEKIDGGVSEALQHWSGAVNGSENEARYKVIRDFIALNKAAARSGCTTTKENDNFRELHDIKKRIRIGGSGITTEGISKNPVTFPSDMVFGQPARPSTPIHEVINHHYLYNWLERMEADEVARVAAEKEATKAISSAYHTKASWLKNAKIPVEEKPYWKMQRFRDIEPAVDSFRTDFQRQKAYSANLLDKVPRQGVNAFKQGVYNVPTTSLPC